MRTGRNREGKQIGAALIANYQNIAQALIGHQNGRAAPAFEEGIRRDRCADFDGVNFMGRHAKRLDGCGQRCRAREHLRDRDLALGVNCDHIGKCLALIQPKLLTHRDPLCHVTIMVPVRGTARVTTSQPVQAVSAAAYLDHEVPSETRQEFIAGEIIPMAGGKPNHNQVALNLAGTLNFRLRRQTYLVFMTDQRLWIPEAEVYTYPDVIVTPRPVELQTGRQDTVLNPVAIAQVLSESTRNYDLGGKLSQILLE